MPSGSAGRPAWQLQAVASGAGPPKPSAPLPLPVLFLPLRPASPHPVLFAETTARASAHTPPRAKDSSSKVSSASRQITTKTSPKTQFLTHYGNPAPPVIKQKSIGQTKEGKISHRPCALSGSCCCLITMCGGCRRRRGGSEAGAGGGRGSCATALAVVALAAAAVVAFLEGTAGGVSYAGDGWFHECAKWDAEGGRFLASTFFGGGVAEVRAGGDGKEEERVVVADPDTAGRVALGLAVDAPRRRVLVAYADRPPRFGYAAVGAYELGSWRRLFLTRLDGPGESSFADDVAADEDGNAYVTNARGNKIWKVSLEGKALSAIKNATFSQRAGTLNNFVGLNGIAYHPNGYLLVVHTSGGDLFKIDPKTETVRVVSVRGSLKRGDGLELLSPTRLAVAGMPSRLVESSDDWETASVTGRYVGPIHRVGSSATVKDGDVYINHIVGFGLGKKKTHVIAKAVFSPL